MAGITISLIERGMRSPDYTGLKRIAKALDTVPSRLVMAIDEIELPPLPRIESEDLPPRRRKWK